jgi:hypothetical protein
MTAVYEIPGFIWVLFSVDKPKLCPANPHLAKSNTSAAGLTLPIHFLIVVQSNSPTTWLQSDSPGSLLPAVSIPEA